MASKFAATRPKSLTAQVGLLGEDFSFKLYTRPLALGPYGRIQYYWMDNSQFRNIRSEASCANFRNCLGHWSAAMRSSGLGGDLDQQIHYVTALCYPLVCRNKSMQSVYRDSHLLPSTVDPAGASLAEDVRDRISDIVRARDRFQLQRELDLTLGRFEVPAKVLPALREAFRRWVGNGVTLMLRKGNVGLEQFLAEANNWLAKYRKMGGHVRVRQFINLFAYEAKASFYRCYANAWIDLISWLRKHQGLDPLSERFLRFWHNQNQPIEVPHGRTPGGIIYPTQHGVTVWEPGPGGAFARRTIITRTEHIGPTHLQDVFSGQVLSLHPLSGFFMKDPGLCAIAGKFFALDNYDKIMDSGRVGTSPEYWDLIGAILTAAHLYRLAVDRQGERRGHRRPAGGDADRAIARDDAPPIESTLWEEYAAAQGFVCKTCGAALRFVRSELPPAASEEATLHFCCGQCKRAASLRVRRDELVAWFGPSGSYNGS
jgi:hypothetical protein